MYLRFRKRRKPLPPNNTDPALAPVLGTAESPAASGNDWVPAEPAGEETPPADVSTGKHPNRGNAHESSRGSHR